MLSNFGMGSVMYNYYRKTNDEDEDLPKVCRQSHIHRSQLDDSFVALSAKPGTNDNPTAKRCTAVSIVDRQTWTNHAIFRE